MRTRILEARVDFFHRPFRTPLRLSTGLITEITEARAEVTVRINGREAAGRGAIYLSDLWAWPDPALTHEQRDAALRGLSRQIARNLWTLCGAEESHPMELGLRLHDHVSRQSDRSVPSVLARAMCASPFDAAIHDAVGIALGRSAFDFYSTDFPLPGADPYFADRNACAGIRRLLQPPRTVLDAWLIVGKDDSMETDVAPWIRNRGYRCFKLKLMGRDDAVDAARTIEVFRAVRQLGVQQPRLTVDTNESNPDAASVLEYLQRLRSEDSEAFAALEYLEQPTGRDITLHPNDWRAVTRLKPVLLDEGLTSLDLMKEAVAQGWSGFALKTCKGHSFALVAAAWAHEHGLMLSLQDLTNPGLAAIHAALFAAHVPTLNGVELNSPQYTPAANQEWLPKLGALLDPTVGIHRLQHPIPPGLGSSG